MCNEVDEDTLVDVWDTGYGDFPGARRAQQIPLRDARVKYGPHPESLTSHYAVLPDGTELKLS